MGKEGIFTNTQKDQAFGNVKVY